MPVRYTSVLKKPIVYTALVLLSSCGKDKLKPGNQPPPPVVNKACRLTYYITDQDLGGNGSKYGLSYDADYNLVQATAFTLQDYRGVTVKIGPSGVNRDNGLSIVAYNYPANIYTENPASGNITITSNITLKQSETYKYDDKQRLIQVDITNAL